MSLLKARALFFFARSFIYPGNFRALTPFRKGLLFNARHSNEINIPQTCNFLKPFCLAKLWDRGKTNVNNLLLLNKWGMRRWLRIFARAPTKGGGGRWGRKSHLTFMMNVCGRKEEEEEEDEWKGKYTLDPHTISRTQKNGPAEKKKVYNIAQMTFLASTKRQKMLYSFILFSCSCFYFGIKLCALSRNRNIFMFNLRVT